jgi:adenosylcobyric acid synthase
MVKAPRALPGDADLIVLPGSKATLADLAFVREVGWDVDIVAHWRRGGAVLGICGGYQMLGQRIGDPDGIEGMPGDAPGLGLLDVETELSAGKTLTEVEGTEPASGEPVAGYEMHIGRTTGPDTRRPMLDLDTGADGAISADGRVRGCYVHGLFAKDPFRHAFLSRLKARRASGVAYEEELDQVLDGLADHLEAHLEVDRILEVAGVR